MTTWRPVPGHDACEFLVQLDDATDKYRVNVRTVAEDPRLYAVEFVQPELVTLSAWQDLAAAIERCAVAVENDVSPGRRGAGMSQ